MTKNNPNEIEQEIITPDGKILGKKKNLWERFILPSGSLGIIAFFVYSFLQFYAGFLGIEHHLGTGWGIAALFLAFIARITLPISIGAFFGAIDVWNWHWFFALLFSAPGLIIFILILFTGGILGTATLRKRR